MAERKRGTSESRQSGGGTKWMDTDGSPPRSRGGAGRVELTASSYWGGSGIHRLMNSSNIGTVKASSLWRGE